MSSGKRTRIVRRFARRCLALAVAASFLSVNLAIHGFHSCDLASHACRSGRPGECSCSGENHRDETEATASSKGSCTAAVLEGHDSGTCIACLFLQTYTGTMTPGLAVQAVSPSPDAYLQPPVGQPKLHRLWTAASPRAPPPI